MISLEDLGTRRREAILSNGARVVVFERSGMPVYMRAAFFGGSRFDADGKEGTAHFLEHMLTAGTKKFPSKDKLAAYIERYGGIFGATTWLDDINVNVAIGEPNDIDRAFEVLHEMLLESLFDDRAFEAERGSILGELRDAHSNPGRWVFDVATRVCFQGTPLAKSTLGTEGAVYAITKDDILTTYREHIAANRMLLMVSGGVTLEEIVEKANRALSIPVSGQPLLDWELPVARRINTEIEFYSGGEQVHAVLSFRTSGIGSKDNASLDVIAEVLGGGRASTLSRVLRYERGLVYSVSANHLEFAGAGMWYIKTSATKKKLQEVFEVIAKEIQRIMRDGLTSEELQFAKDKIAKSKRMELQSSGSWVGFHTRRQLINPAPWTFIDYIHEIQAVTVADTKRVAEKYFTPDGWYVALCGDIAEDEVRFHF